LNIAQEVVHYALQRNVFDRDDADEIHRTAEVGESHARDPAFASVASVDVRRAMVVRENVDPSSCPFRNEHAAHGIG
jgi:uncharacterized protein YPO0396